MQPGPGRRFHGRGGVLFSRERTDGRTEDERTEKLGRVCKAAGWGSGVAKWYGEDLGEQNTYWCAITFSAKTFG